MDKPKSEAEIDLTWLLAGRICLLSLGLVAATFFTFFVDPTSFGRVKFVYAGFAGLYLFCVTSAIWLRYRKPSWLFTYSQLAADMLIVTGVTYITGGPYSPFLFMYLPPVMVAAILRSRRTALAMSLFGFALYAALVDLLTRGFLRNPDGSLVSGPSDGALILQQLGLLSAMILIAVATSFLKGKLTASYQYAESSQSALIDGIPDGVISLKLDGAISAINSAATDLLKISRDQVLGKTLEQLIGEIDPEFKDQSVFSGTGGREISLHPTGSPELKLIYHRQALASKNGQESGALVIFQDVTKLRSIEEEFALQERMARMLAESAKDTGPTYTKINRFVGESPVMQKVFKLIDRVAQSDATVMINGESGTGKELVAKAIHLGGARASRPFVPVNCGAIPETLIESELFGHKRGSFTGAHADHTGLFRQAEGGTIFLDEIAELPIQMQAKLLRAIQEKMVRPVGADFDVPIDVRIVAATNKNLKEEITRGKFREDLFYRLNVISVRLPALRDRREDIPLLVNSILRTLCKSEELPTVSPKAMRLLLKYNYPGNVRELENILERACVLGSGMILEEHLPDGVREPQAASPTTEQTLIHIDESLNLPVDLDQVLGSLEKKYIELALLHTKGAKKKAANLLGMNFRSFRYRLQKYDMQEQDEDAKA